MQRISITNPQNIIDGTAKKYYFKLRNTGGPKGDKGDKGDTGSQGPQGPKGDAATVAIGSTTTLPVGYDATVENVGSIYNAVLNFGIPQGPQGPQGAKGDKGDTGAQGETGPRGPQGEKGTNATVYVGTTTTTNPGTQARVYNTGTENNAVLNFEIPRGAKGDKGDTGAQGEPGPAGQNFAPTVVTELPETGDSSKLYLTPKAHTTSTATGNPITASVTEQAGTLESFKLDGDTFQQSYTGKNLLNLSASRDFNSGTDYSFDVSSGVLTATKSSASAVNRYSGWCVTGLTPGAKYTFSIESFTNSALSNTDRAIMIRSHNGTSVTDLATLNKTQTSYTFTVPNDSVRLDFYFYIASGNTDSTSTITKPMLEAGETATDYEPFVGGQPSPSPDFPQQIQTVTGEQTVEIVGKNLFDKNTSTPGLLNGDGSIGDSDDYSTSDFIQVAPDTTYYKTQTTSARFKFYGINKTPISSVYDDIPNATYAQSFTTPSSCYYIRFSFRNIAKDSIQIELGSTATTYAPYSKQTLPLNLGSIELCKLGTYQDYIWKDGEDWKVHKATGKYVYNNNLGENGIGSTYVAMLTPTLPTLPNMAFTDGLFWCNSYTPTMQNNTGLQGTNASGRIRVNTSLDIADSYAKVRALAAANNLTIHYPLATATDTEITNTALIAQLEAIRTASLENGTNTITNTATGSNIAGDMEIGYYEYDPNNRYDKWLWLDLNNNYEQIGS